MSGAAIGRDALRRVRRGMFALVAAALCVAVPAFADDGISGSATLFDLTFTNTTAFAYNGVSGLTLKFNSGVTPSYNNDNCDDSTGLYLKYTPWISGAHSTFNGLENFTLVVVGTMSSANNTIFIHLGSSGHKNGVTYTGLLITSTDNDDEVLIAKNTGATVDAANGVRVSVPNAASARHAYVIVKSGTTFTVWVDGVKRGSFTVPSGYKLGVDTHSGVQVGSDYGGEIKKTGVYNAVQSDDNSGVVNVIRVFDKVVSDAQMEAVFAAYPYVSKGGLYTRTVSADGTFSSTDAWAKDGESGAFAAPEGATVDGVYYNPSATLDVNAAATLTVNADIALDTLTVGGSEPLTFAADRTHTLSVVGAAVINSPVTNEYGAVNISSTPVQLGSNGSICFDYSGFDISGISETTRYQLTGLIEQDDTKVTLIPPTHPGRTAALVYNTTGSYYEFAVAPNIWTLVKNGGDGNYKAENAWKDCLGSYRTWTAETSAEQIDYIIPKGYTFSTGYGDTNESEFMLPQNTDSTVTLNGTINVMWIHTTIPNLVMKDSSRMYLHLARNAATNFRRPRRVSGSARIDASDATPAIFDTFAYIQNQMQTNAMTMTGSGAIRYTHTPHGDNIHGQIVVTGDNSGFTGSVSVYKSGTAANKNMHLYVSSGENIGGNPATFKEKGLEISGAYLHVQGDTALGENRGFYVSGDSSTVYVSSGATFTVPTEIGFADGGYTLAKTGAGTMKVPGWTTGTVAVNAGTLNLVGATFANGAAGTPVAIGGIEYSSGATVTLAVEGDGSELPMANATNVLLVAESALPADFADKVQLVGGDSAYTVPSRLKTRLIVVDGVKFALETVKSKGFLLIVK